MVTLQIYRVNLGMNEYPSSYSFLGGKGNHPDMLKHPSSYGTQELEYPPGNRMYFFEIEHLSLK
jgi:hypothetical protein